VKYQSDYETIDSLKALKDTIDTLQAECKHRLAMAQQLQSEAQDIQYRHDSINAIGEFIESVGGRSEFFALVQTLDQVVEPLETFQAHNQTLLDSIQDILSLFASLSEDQSLVVVQDHGFDSAEEDIAEVKDVSLLSSLGKLGLASTIIDVQKELKAARELTHQLKENRIEVSNQLNSVCTEFRKLDSQTQEAAEQLVQKTVETESLYQDIKDLSSKIESTRNEIEATVCERQNNVEHVQQYSASAEEAASEAKECISQANILYQELQSLFLELQNANQDNKVIYLKLEADFQKTQANLDRANNYLNDSSKLYQQLKLAQELIEQGKEAFEQDRKDVKRANSSFSMMERELKDLRTQCNYLDKKSQKLQKRLLYLFGGFIFVFFLFLISFF
jgi:chromosome segregation ATPase